MGDERGPGDAPAFVEPYLRDSDLTLYRGDVREVLLDLPDESVDCVVTSPPYWGLRDYGTGTWIVDCPTGFACTGCRFCENAREAAEGCDHTRPAGTYNQGFNERWGQGGGQKKQERKSDAQYAERCPKCGARRVDDQIGLEPTLAGFLEGMVSVFREVRRVLAPHGTVWLNMGDGYASKARGSDEGWDKSRLRNPGYVQKAQGASLRSNGERHRGKSDGLKPKDLMMVPHRLAIALQDDGWWVRMDNVWSKSNPMPESIVDRPTKAHEYVFLLAKSGDPHYWVHRDGRLESTRPEPDWRWVNVITREEVAEPQSGREWHRINLWRGHTYFYDQEATREAFSEGTHSRGRGATQKEVEPGQGIKSNSDFHAATARSHVDDARHRPQEETLGDLPPEAPRGPDGRRETHVESREGSLQHRDGERWPASGRNMRSVWSIPTQGYPGAHFATFPEELARRCIEAGCPLEVCRSCGKPRTRMVDVGYENPGNRSSNGRRETGSLRDQGVRVMSGGRRLDKTTGTTGWSNCSCADYRAGLVMDPFGGSGTVGVVARAHGRHALLVELSPDYCELIVERTSQLSLLAEEAP